MTAEMARGARAAREGDVCPQGGRQAPDKGSTVRWFGQEMRNNEDIRVGLLRITNLPSTPIALHVVGLDVSPGA